MEHESRRSPPPRCTSAPTILVGATNLSTRTSRSNDIPNLISTFKTLRSPRHYDDQPQNTFPVGELSARICNTNTPSLPNKPVALKSRAAPEHLIVTQPNTGSSIRRNTSSPTVISCCNDVSDSIDEPVQHVGNDNSSMKRRKAAAFRKQGLKLDIHQPESNTCTVESRIESSEQTNSQYESIDTVPDCNHVKGDEQRVVQRTPKRPPMLNIGLCSESFTAHTQEVTTPKSTSPPSTKALRRKKPPRLDQGSMAFNPVSITSVPTQSSPCEPVGEWARKQQDRKYAKMISQVEPHLYIGSVEGAQNAEQREKLGITAMLDCAKPTRERVSHHEHHRRMLSEMKHSDRKMEYWTLSLHDRSAQDATCHFYNAIEIIESIRAKGGIILVHCVKGISRSAAVVVAYLMWKYTWNLDEAMSFLKTKRPTVNPNAGFIFQLFSWSTNRPSIASLKCTSNVTKNNSPRSEAKGRTFVYKIDLSETMDFGILGPTHASLIAQMPATKSCDEDTNSNEQYMPLAVGPLHQVGMTEVYSEPNVCYLVCPCNGDSQYIWFNPQQCERKYVIAACHAATQLHRFESTPRKLEFICVGKESKQFWVALAAATEETNDEVQLSPKASSRVKLNFQQKKFVAGGDSRMSKCQNDVFEESKSFDPSEIPYLDLSKEHNNKTDTIRWCAGLSTPRPQQLLI